MIAITYARALHQLLAPGVIIIGRDSRPSGARLMEAIVEEWLALGRDVVSCGIVPTPTVQFTVKNTTARGGVIVTASHNPVEWNGLKFVRSDGTFFHPAECRELFTLADQDPALRYASKPGLFWIDHRAVQKQILANASLKCIDLNRIRHRQFEVVLDAVNGAGAEALPLMLESLGCEVRRLNCVPNGEFTRGTEPLPHNLTDLCDTVKSHGADVGFALDPDADRLAVVSERGEPLGEEYTLVIAVEGYIETTGRKETFVTNLSSSMALDKLAELHGCQVARSAVGEIHVVRKMLETGANLGGEGNGGVILKEAHLGRDAMVGVTLVLNRMAQTDKPLSAIQAALPQYTIVKAKIELEGLLVDKMFDRVKKTFKDAELNILDGLKFRWPESWIHLRKSNTEPILRIYAEALSMEEAKGLIETVKSLH